MPSSNPTSNTAVITEAPASTGTRQAAGRWRLYVSLLAWWPLWAVLILALGALVLAYQVPHDYTVQVGSPSDEAYVTNFHPRLDDNGRPYRWSDVYGYVAFPGLGGGRPFTMTVDLNASRRAPVTLIVNGTTFLTQTMNPGWHTVTLKVDSSKPLVLASRDTVLEVRAPDYRTEDSPTEPKGVEVARVAISQAVSGGLILPPYSRVAQLEVFLLLLYVFAARSLTSVAVPGRARAWALVAAALCGAAAAMSIAGDHIYLSAAAWHLVVTLASALVIALLCETGARRLGRRLNPTEARVFGAVVGVGFALRFGGMALPQSVIIDMPWHMKWLGQLLTGDWQSLYFPGGLSSVPREWGLNVLIPKSPLFYFFVAPASLLPFNLQATVKWVVCLMDASVILAVFWIARRLSASAWPAIWAAAGYALMPLAFRSFAYGILPTIFAQWLAAWALVLLLWLVARPRRWTAWAVFTLLLALTLVAFPTVAVFMTVVLLGVTVAWAFVRPRESERGRIDWRTPVSLAVAWALALWSYYGIYVALVIASVTELLTPKPGTPSSVRWPGGFLQLLGWTADYVVTLLPAICAVTGLALVFALRGLPARRKRVLWLVTIWLAIGPLFVLVNYRMDMIGKHLFFIMAPVAIGAGVALFLLSARRRWDAVLAALVIATIGWQGLVFWIDRLIGAWS